MKRYTLEEAEHFHKLTDQISTARNNTARLDKNWRSATVMFHSHVGSAYEGEFTNGDIEPILLTVKTILEKQFEDLKARRDSLGTDEEKRFVFVYGEGFIEPKMEIKTWRQFQGEFYEETQGWPEDSAINPDALDAMDITETMTERYGPSGAATVVTVMRVA